MHLSLYSLDQNGGSTFHLPWRFFPRSGHLQHHSYPKAICRCPNILFVQFCELLWDPSCTGFMEGKPVVDNFIGWTKTNLQLMCHFINSHLSILQDHVMDSFCVCISNGRGWVSGFFLMINACATILEPLGPFVDKPLWQGTVPILRWDHGPLLFFGANEKWSVHVYGKKLTSAMDYQSHTCTTMVGQK